MTASNFLITGLPRSGTTLVCYLLNKLPNHVALHEPMEVMKLAGLSVDAVMEEVLAFANLQRQSILETGKARSRAMGGKVPPNPLADAIDGKRRRLIDGREIIVDNITQPGFNLYIKHPALFTALLPAFSQCFTCYVTVRNPLAVLISWRTSGMDVANGRLPVAEAFDQALKSRLAVEDDVLARHFILLDYCFSRYANIPPDRVMKYEDTVASGGAALRAITPAAAALAEPLSLRNRLQLGAFRDASDVANRLCDSDNACFRFYRREEVMGLLTGD